MSPDAAGAGVDACVSATTHKLEKYGPILEELRNEGMEYTPAVWTCWGRPGSAAAAAVRSLACAAARRHGIADPTLLERHTNAIIGCFIWKRAACMVLACLGRQACADVEQLLQLSWSRWLVPNEER